MTNKTLLTTSFRSSAVIQAYYSQSSYFVNNPSQMYCFLSYPESWVDDLNPPQPTQDMNSLRQIMDRIFVVKKISTNDMAPVIQRINWSSGNYYDSYLDNVDLFQLDGNGNLALNFYVKNKYDQVFKCLSNNYVNGVAVASTYEPYFQPGTYDTNKLFQAADGYVWKYMYTIDNQSKLKFMDQNWIPVPITTTGANPTIDTTIGVGNIDVINVIQSGSGYSASVNPPVVSITGEYSINATANTTIVDGKITKITVNNHGTDFSYANASIVTQTGSGAVLYAPISPIGGHGSDPLYELGCRNLMITSTFSGAETDVSGVDMIPVDINYHQIGILVNPTSLSTAPLTANGTIYKTTTDLIVSGGSGIYLQDETIYQGTSSSNTTFSATVLSFDSGSNILKVVNVRGNLIINGSIKSLTSGTTRTLLSYSSPNFLTSSGYISYIENRSSIQRSYDGIEQFKLVLSY